MTRKYLLLFLLFLGLFSFSQNVAPILSATGNQAYCPTTSIPIVTSMSIVDPDDVGIDAMYIQISSGYVLGEDVLNLTGTNPNINSSWSPIEGKLTLTGISNQPTYIELINAIENVVFSNNNPNANGQRTFSITVGQANYLEATDHYYQYVPNIGITWQNAKIAAENSTYYGLQGYLATITSMAEVQISGIQATGAGWIGGSDDETEGVWKWVTGPESGTVLWNGLVNGTSPNFAFWNTNEPNNFGNANENFAHVTAPGVGIPGSWNDLPNSGDPSGDYQPKGYIVEYGGMPNDPTLQISTTTSIFIPNIINSSGNFSCGSGSLTLLATAVSGSVNWYSNAVGGTPIFTGNAFNTPFLNATTTYYVEDAASICNPSNRIAVTATITPIPSINITNPIAICEGNSATLIASSDFGTINWYDSATSNSPIFVGNSYQTPSLNQSTTFYIQARFNNCTSPRIPITVPVNGNPSVTDVSTFICENSTIVLNAGINNATYLWSTGATTSNITINNSGNYSVIITNTSNCSATKNFTISLIASPVIESVLVALDNVTILTTNSGDFEYSIDGVTYYDSNIFSLNNGGLYNAYVREKNDCGFDIKPFVFLSIPRFFSPNGDGTNEYWKVKGIENYNDAKTYIFDRFGKLITELNSRNLAWDGTFNEMKLPASDYWYFIEIESLNQTFKGHFSLLR
ncbi:T9SS type B sorting domain-containing protein [Flavobacterium sp.]|uniref:Ig-like domain-containing protein n=1 Tax=Flavobacterium sp. TaxID=239 RepID=UPI003F69DE33